VHVNLTWRNRHRDEVPAAAIMIRPVRRRVLGLNCSGTGVSDRSQQLAALLGSTCLPIAGAATPGALAHSPPSRARALPICCPALRPDHPGATTAMRGSAPITIGDVPATALCIDQEPLLLARLQAIGLIEPDTRGGWQLAAMPSGAPRGAGPGTCGSNRNGCRAKAADGTSAKHRAAQAEPVGSARPWLPQCCRCSQSGARLQRLRWRIRQVSSDAAAARFACLPNAHGRVPG
jgi:hypothetical protein